MSFPNTKTFSKITKNGDISKTVNDKNVSLNFPPPPKDSTFELAVICDMLDYSSMILEKMWRMKILGNNQKIRNYW